MFGLVLFFFEVYTKEQKSEIIFEHRSIVKPKFCFVLQCCLYLFQTTQGLYTAQTSNGVNSSNSANLPVKRTALTDSKTGMPIYHTYATNIQQQLQNQQPQHSLNLAAAVQQQQHQHTVTALNYPAINFPLQYGQYISLPCNSSIYNNPKTVFML